jgi:hypothetical protein
VASVGSTPTTAAQTAANNTSAKKDPLAMSRCMRAHGVPNFPDPDANGGISINGGAGGLDPGSAVFQAADKVCRPLGGDGPGGTPAQQAQNREAMLKFARCMRAHGLPDFPDPQPNGGMVIQKRGSSGGANASSSNLTPDSPVFQAAQKACAALDPGHGRMQTSIRGGSAGSGGK